MLTESVGWGKRENNIVKERKANGPYKSFTDFCERIADESVNKKCVESLIKAGAFDSFGDSSTSEKIKNIDEFINYCKALKSTDISNDLLIYFIMKILNFS